MSMNSNASAQALLQTLYLGGGCFWCTEAVFLRVQGVQRVESGYANGQGPKPSYEDVCTGQTGYAEVVRVDFDPQVIGVEALLEIFFQTHDPTTLNRQGNDVGTQYRSAIYAEDAVLLEGARKVKARLEQVGAWSDPIVTEIDFLRNYWPAEGYHQDYFARNPAQGYCVWVVRPKVEKLRHSFADWLKPGG